MCGNDRAVHGSNSIDWGARDTAPADTTDRCFRTAAIPLHIFRHDVLEPRAIRRAGQSVPAMCAGGVIRTVRCSCRMAEALSVVIEETPLRRRIGTVEVHRNQRRHLIKQAESNHIHIHFLSTGGWRPGLHGPFTCFDMPDPYPDVAYVENLVGRPPPSRTKPKSSNIDRHTMVFRHKPSTLAKASSPSADFSRRSSAPTPIGQIKRRTRCGEKAHEALTTPANVSKWRHYRSPSTSATPSITPAAWLPSDRPNGPR